MMHMKNNITSHRRFIKKAEKDLVRLFKENASENFIERYQAFCKMAEPDLRLEEMYYESLDDVKDYQGIIDYALLMMNEGRGDYQLHMIELLKALYAAERYYDVINFADQLMEENISQGFRMDVANERHKAKLKLEAQVEETDNLYHSNAADIHFEEMSKGEILQFLGVITDEEDSRFEDKVVHFLKDVESPELVTFMLLYLKSIHYREEVEYQSSEGTEKTVPDTLPQLEDLKLIQEVLPEVVDDLEQNAPEMVEEVKMLLTSHAIYSFPQESNLKGWELTRAYLFYIYSLINIESGIEVSEEAMSWIYHMENEVNSYN